MNLINVNQLCDQDLFVRFTKDKCIVLDQDQQHIMEANRLSDNCHLFASPNTCLTTVQNDTNLWHKQVGHVSHNNLKDTIVAKAIREVPNIKGELERMYGPCQLGKQVRTPHPKSQLGSCTRVLGLVHMDLMGPMKVESFVGKRYVHLCVDDFSKTTWVNFLITKFEAFEAFEVLWQRLYKEHNNKLLNINRIRNDHGKEFENSLFENLCMKNGIEHEFSTPKTPQKNRVVERKKKTLQKMAWVMLNAKSVLTKFCAETVNTTCYISNQVYLRSGTLKTSYDI